MRFAGTAAMSSVRSTIRRPSASSTGSQHVAWRGTPRRRARAERLEPDRKLRDRTSSLHVEHDPAARQPIGTRTVVARRAIRHLGSGPCPRPRARARARSRASRGPRPSPPFHAGRSRRRARTPAPLQADPRQRHVRPALPISAPVGVSRIHATRAPNNPIAHRPRPALYPAAMARASASSELPSRRSDRSGPPGRRARHRPPTPHGCPR